MTEERAGLPILAFADAGALERWLESQPADSKGAWLKLAKSGSGRAGVTKAEAIDAALCHGWIDGQLDKYDDSGDLLVIVIDGVTVVRFELPRLSLKGHGEPVTLLATLRLSFSAIFGAAADKGSTGGWISSPLTRAD